MARFSLAYVHTLLSLRLPSLALSSLNEQGTSVNQVKTELGELVPFLVEAKSSVRYESARDAWASVWENIGKTLVRSCWINFDWCFSSAGSAFLNRPPHPAPGAAEIATSPTHPRFGTTDDHARSLRPVRTVLHTKTRRSSEEAGILRGGAEGVETRRLAETGE